MIKIGQKFKYLCKLIGCEAQEEVELTINLEIQKILPFFCFNFIDVLSFFPDGTLSFTC